MCEPVSIISGLGAAATAVGGFQSQNEQTRVQNRQIADKYNNDRVNYELGNLQRLAIQGTKELDSEINQDALALSASNAISQSTIEEADASRRLEQKLQDIQIAQLKGSGKASEGGRARSFDKNSSLTAGRSIGSLQAQRARLGVAGFAARRATINDYEQKRIAEWRKVSLGAGEAGPAPKKPTFAKGPSKLALGLNLAMAGATAVSPMFKSKPGLSPGAGSQGIPDVSSINQNNIVTQQGLNYSAGGTDIV